MPPNLDRYRKDLDSLVEKGETLHLSMQAEFLPEQFEKAIKKAHGKEGARKVMKALPSFTRDYQSWYSEAKALIKQLLPDRLGDFVGHYEPPKGRKEIAFASYRIADCLIGLNVTRGISDFDKVTVVSPDAAVPQFRQQLAILKSARARL